VDELSGALEGGQSLRSPDGNNLYLWSSKIHHVETRDERGSLEYLPHHVSGVALIADVIRGTPTTSTR
jgi:hypothetical protein